MRQRPAKKATPASKPGRSGSRRSGSGGERRSGSGGDRPGGRRSDGDKPGSRRADGDKPGGRRSGSDRPGGRRADGDKPGSRRADGDKPGGRRSGSDRPGGRRADGDKPGSRRADGDKPGGRRSGGDRPAGRRSSSAGEKPDGRRAGSGGGGRRAGSGSERPAARQSGSDGRDSAARRENPSRRYADGESRSGGREERRPSENWKRREEEDYLYGRRPVLEALRAKRPLNRLYVLAGAAGVPPEVFELAEARGVPVVRSERDRLERLARGGNHQGVVAQVAARDFDSLDELVGKLGKKPLLLALDGVQDPHNLGALLRTAEAAGVAGVVLTTRNSCGLTAAVSRAAAGADQFLTIARTDKLERLLKDCAKRGFAVVAADMSGKTLFGGADMTGPTVVVLGAEGEGLSARVAEACTHRLRLPMLGQIESLNVSVSGALFLYEAVRQRSLK